MRELGRLLKEGRLALGLEIEDIAKKTRISSYYLKAIEEGRFQMIPKGFDKGYLKIFADALHIDPKPILALFEQHKKEEAAANQPLAQKSV